MATNLITVTQAAAMTARFRSNNQSFASGSIPANGVLPLCETFNRVGFDALLADRQVTGMRIYLGMKENNDIVLIVAGVNANNEDVFITTGNPANDLGAEAVIEEGLRCPTICPPPSPLNT